MNELISQFSLGGAGPSIVIKDSIDIAGMRSVAGSRGLADIAPAAQHAEVVQRLLDANWHITGKATMHELAFGMTGINDYTGTATNPQAPDRIPGGSSSGSAAAVGAGLADAALGTDTGGSIRGPAACCGVIGLKPTFGRVSRRGAAPQQSTLDCVGPFARTMPMIVAAMAAITPDFDTSAASATQIDGRPFRLAVCHAKADAAIDAAFTAAVQAAVAQAQVHLSPATLPGMEAAFAAALTIINIETSQAFGHLTGKGMLGADLEARLVAAATTSASDVAAAERVRKRFTDEVDALLESVDVLVLPTLPSLPITVAQARAGASVIGVSSLIRPFNLSGHPAITVPMPVAGETIKAGLQIVGRHGDDELVCAVAAVFEKALQASGTERG
ncbi:MAG: amidase [Janthinobacterium lividum]